IAIAEGFEDSSQQDRVRDTARELRQGLFALDQMNQVAVDIVEERQTITLIFERLAYHLDTVRLQVLYSGIEVIQRDGEMTEASVFVIRDHLWGGERVRRGDDFDHRAVRGTHEVVPGIGEIDVELQIVHVPLRKSF